jgi:hypothetical protein
LKTLCFALISAHLRIFSFLAILSLLKTKRFERVFLELGMALSFPCGFGTGISLRPGYGLRFVVIQKQVVNEACFLFEFEIRGLKFKGAKKR